MSRVWFFDLRNRFLVLIFGLDTSLVELRNTHATEVSQSFKIAPNIIYFINMNILVMLGVYGMFF